MNGSILIVDDEVTFLESMVRILRLEGFEDLTTISDPMSVKDILKNKEYSVAFLDISMPGIDGLELLQEIKVDSPHTECIMITADDRAPTIVRALKLGAYDYITKPITPDRVILTLKQVFERSQFLKVLELHNSAPRPDVSNVPEAFGMIATVNQNFIRLIREAELHAGSNIPILITGETGVGKEVFARAIHKCSRRNNGPFSAINMIAVATTLFESEFFGHVRGAFTGADRDQPGYLASAKGGTIFLDEIGDLPMEVQGKLLRILQEDEYVPVGKSKSEKADVRFIAATNQDLDKLIRQGRFRKDLYYRLQFARLNLPPLRDRIEDLPILCAQILESFPNRKYNISEGAQEILASHPFPGNVRELIGLLQAAVNLAGNSSILDKKHFPYLLDAKKKEKIAPLEDGMDDLASVERRHILNVYKKTGQNKSETARVLKIGLRTLYRKLDDYGVEL